MEIGSFTGCNLFTRTILLSIRSVPEVFPGLKPVRLFLYADIRQLPEVHFLIRRLPSIRAWRGMRRSDIYCETVIAIRRASPAPISWAITTSPQAAGCPPRRAGPTANARAT